MDELIKKIMEEKTPDDDVIMRLLIEIISDQQTQLDGQEALLNQLNTRMEREPGLSIRKHWKRIVAILTGYTLFLVLIASLVFDVTYSSDAETFIQFLLSIVR